MNSNDLRREHARVIQASIQPMCVYLNQLKQRMAERGFPLDDPLYVLVEQAQRSVGELSMNLATRSYGGPIGTPLLDERMSKKQNDRR